MAEPKPNPEPRGFSEHTRKSSGENAHQQGWGLNEEERRRLSSEKKTGGTDYDYGARDFGDNPVDTSAAKPAAKTSGESSRPNRRTGI